MRSSEGRVVSFCSPEDQLNVSDVPKDLLFVFLWLCAEPDKTPFDQDESPNTFASLIAFFEKHQGRIGEWVTRRRIAFNFEADVAEIDLYEDANGKGAAFLALTLAKAFIDEFGCDEAVWKELPYWEIPLENLWLKEAELRTLAYSGATDL